MHTDAHAEHKQKLNIAVETINLEHNFRRIYLTTLFWLSKLSF